MKPTFWVNLVASSYAIMHTLKSILKYFLKDYIELWQLSNDIDIARVEVATDFYMSLSRSKKE